MEQKILLQHCEENPSVETAKYIALVDKDELERTDMTWEEIEPYTRILGIRTQDLLIQNPEKKQNMHKIEGKILSHHEKLCKLLQTQDLVGSTKKLCDYCESLENDLKDVQDKQKKCCEKVLNYLNEIYKKLVEIGVNDSERKNPFSELALRLKKIKLKAQYLKNSVDLEIYSERSSKALGVIKEELENTYDEYNDIRVMLNERINTYENNESINGLLKKYTVLKQRIKKKQQDILSISK